MSDQTTFASLAWTGKKKVTRRERFLAEMEAAIPWARLVALVAPHYPVSGRGRPSMPIERMLRIHFLQHWFNLSDPAAEDALYDSESMRRFAGLELGEDAVPDESTILRFRHLLERHRLSERIFSETKAVLEEAGLVIKEGTLVDATLIAAASSTKNRDRKRDPEMRSTKKGNQWHFGMKVHAGTDPNGIVHSLRVTDAACSDINQLPHLIHGAEDVLYGDKAYWCEGDRQAEHPLRRCCGRGTVRGVGRQHPQAPRRAASLAAVHTVAAIGIGDAAAHSRCDESARLRLLEEAWRFRLKMARLDSAVIIAPCGDREVDST